MAESVVSDILNYYNNIFAGVYYLIPIMSFSILVGLAMDYDIFLMFRVSVSYFLLIFVSALLWTASIHILLFKCFVLDRKMNRFPVR